MKNAKENGITLIALIISIIILLILAGVTISSVIGDNGILNNATEASDVTEEAKVLEEIELCVSAYKTGKYAGTETRTLSEYLKDELDITTTRESELGTIIFKLNNKVIVLNDYDTVSMTIKEYQPNTLANNAKNIADGGTITISENIGFLTDDGIPRKYIKNITFDTTNTIPSSYDISWDVSEIQDGTVIAYAIGDETNGYDITIVADGEIYLPEDSKSMFRYCGYNENLSEYEVDLNGLNTSKVTNMSNLFCDFGYYSMTNFNLGENFDTSNVTNMEGMFGRCGYMKLQSLNLENKFNTSNVTNMRSIFYYCGYNSMISLTLGNKFDTSNAINMIDAFGNCGCKNMTEIYFGKAFNETSKITDLNNVLIWCGTSTCKYYVSSETAQNWLLNLDSTLRRTENWNSDYIIVK